MEESKTTEGTRDPLHREAPKESTAEHQGPCGFRIRLYYQISLLMCV
jgi:hypothetical protein